MTQLRVLFWLGLLLGGFALTIAEDYNEFEPECIRLPPRVPSITPENTTSLFELLEGNEIPAATEESRDDDAILVLGNTGSGKTTITQILAGDLTRIHAVLTQSDKLIIIDDDDRIGGPSTVSKTIIPELVILNSENDTVAFYDCPGFDDTRGPDIDIAANYYMNQLVKGKVKRIKMLFLVIHSSVKLGNDRLDFDLLVDHASKFVRNFRKYKDSFGLVVTKVSSFSEWGRRLSDRVLLNGVVEFLTIYNQTLHSKLAETSENSTERETIENKVFFVTTLLQQDDEGNYPKISVSRNPEACGPLSNSTVVAKTRQQVSKMYRDNLKYTSVYKEDFGFTLKHKTILHIQNYSIALNKNVADRLESVFKEFETWYDGVHISTNRSTKTISEQLRRENSAVESLIQNLNNSASNNLTIFTDLVTEYLKHTDYSIPSQLRSFMSQQQTYLEFFTEAVSGHQNGQTPLGNFESWLKPVLQFQEKYLIKLLDWYEFLSNVEKQLTTYSFHASKKAGVGQKRGSELLQYLETGASIPVGTHIWQITSDLRARHFTLLESMLKFATEPTKVACSGIKLTATGNYVRLGEFIDHGGNLIQHQSCNVGAVRKIEIFASTKIFIDRDINGYGKELNVILLAPTWDIIQNRQFNLNGLAGADAHPPAAENGPEYIYRAGGHGKDGMEGNPGGPGGNLFGAASRVEGSGVLKAASNGGRGGKGQHGGNGGAGDEGRNSDRYDARENDWSTNLITITYLSSHGGHSGYPGGNGGSGGPGGSGGNAGSIRISIEGAGSEKISTYQLVGETGADGQGGQGGQGGRDGRGIQCENKKILFFLPFGIECTQRGQTYHRGDKGMDGLSKGWRRLDHGGLIYIPRSPARFSMSLTAVDKKEAVDKYKTLFPNTTGNSGLNAFVRFIETMF